MSKPFRTCFAGFGGQGVMSMGMLLAYAGLLEDKNVTWCPSYGPEMRGGTSNCAVIVSDNPISTPIVAKNASSVVIMNEASYDKFVDVVEPNGSIYVNSSLVKRKVERDDVKVYYIPANDIANELGNSKLLNIIMLGALVEKEKVVNPESVIDAFTKVFGESKAKFIPINREALKRGSEVAKQL